LIGATVVTLNIEERRTLPMRYYKCKTQVYAENQCITALNELDRSVSGDRRDVNGPNSRAGFDHLLY
jgi:hypothetical protein